MILGTRALCLLYLICNIIIFGFAKFLVYYIDSSLYIFRWAKCLCCGILMRLWSCFRHRPDSKVSRKIQHTSCLELLACSHLIWISCSSYISQHDGSLPLHMDSCYFMHHLLLGAFLVILRDSDITLLMLLGGGVLHCPLVMGVWWGHTWWLDEANTFLCPFLLWFCYCGVMHVALVWFS